MDSAIPPLSRFAIKSLLLATVVLSWAIPFYTFGGAARIKEAYAHPLPAEESLLHYQEQWHAVPEEDIERKEEIHAAATELRWHLCFEGKHEHCPEPVPVAKNVDLDRLAYAVAVAETSNCTAGTGRSKNNCHGIFGCRNGDCGPRTFESTDRSFWEFKKLWLRAYGDRFPTLADAKKYSGGPGDTWLNRVTIAYNRGPK